MLSPGARRPTPSSRFPEPDGRVVFEGGEQLGEGLIERGVAGVGDEFGEGREGEAPEVEARVWEREERRLDARATAEQEVQVERARERSAKVVAPSCRRSSARTGS